MSLSDPNLTHSDSFHQTYIVFFPHINELQSFCYKHRHRLNIPKIIMNWRNGLIFINLWSVMAWIVLNVKLISLWKNKIKSFPRWLPPINWMSQRSQVIQGLIKDLMIHTARCNIPKGSAWRDTPKAGRLLAHTPQQESKGDGDEPPSKKGHLFVVNSVLQVTLNVSREKGLAFWGLQRH